MINATMSDIFLAQNEEMEKKVLRKAYSRITLNESPKNPLIIEWWLNNAILVSMAIKINNQTKYLFLNTINYL